MNCGKCGAPLDDDAVFCVNCGAKVENPTPDAAPQPNPMSDVSGYEVPPMGGVPTDVNADGTATDNGNKNKMIGVIAVAVAAVIVIVLVCTMLFRRSAKDCVKDFYNSLEKASAGKLLKLVPKDVQEEMIDKYDLDGKKELKEAVQDYLDDMLDDFEDDYGDDVKISLEFKDKEEISKKDLKSLNEELDDDYGMDEAKKGYEIEIKAEIKGDDDHEKQKDTAYVFKYKGKWYSYDAIGLVNIAAYYASNDDDDYYDDFFDYDF